MKNLKKILASGKGGKTDMEIPEGIARGIDRILKEDRRQKAYLAGIDEDKFNYQGLTYEELISKLRERGIEWT